MDTSIEIPTNEQLVNEYGSYVNKLVNRMIHNREHASDVSQEIWLELIKSLPSFKGESKLSSWIYTISSRIVLRESKREKVHSQKGIEAFFSAKEQYYSPVEADQALWVNEKCERCVTSFLHCISHEDRLALLLKDLLELDYETVAEITEKSTVSLRKQVSRSREKISRYINHECAVVGTNSNCRCRIRDEVSKTELAETYAKFKAAREVINELTLLDKTFPSKNYWTKFL